VGCSLASVPTGSKKSELIKAGFPQYPSQAKSEYIHKQLFEKRNRIMHWGEVTFEKDDASAGLAAAIAAISVLKAMDREKYLAMEREGRPSMNN
jgi:ATP-dependent Lon protease